MMWDPGVVGSVWSGAEAGNSGWELLAEGLAVQTDISTGP